MASLLNSVDGIVQCQEYCLEKQAEAECNAKAASAMHSCRLLLCMFVPQNTVESALSLQKACSEEHLSV